MLWVLSVVLIIPQGQARRRDGLEGVHSAAPSSPWLLGNEIQPVTPQVLVDHLLHASQ